MLDSRSRNNSPLTGQERLWLILILLLALTLRLAGGFVISNGQPLTSDEPYYILMAENLLSTGAFGKMPGVPTGTIIPLYPIFVAGIFAVSEHSLVAVRLVQAMLSAASALLVFGTARTLLPERPLTHWLAYVVTAFYPVFALYTGRIMTETLYLFLTMLCLFLWAKSLVRPTFFVMLGAGAAAALSLLVRETLIFFYPLFLLGTCLFFSARQWLRYAFIFALGFLLCYSPVMIRNYRMGGSLIFGDFGRWFQSNIVESQVEATEAGAAVVTTTDKVAPVLERWSGEPFSELWQAPSNILFDPGFLMAQPLFYLRMITARFAELWLHPMGLDQFPEAIGLAYRLPHILLFVAALAGLILVVVRRYWAMSLVALMLPYITAIRVLTRPYPRYTFAYLPIAFILAAFAVDVLWRKIGTRNG